MSVETAQYIHQLNPANPSGADKLASGDDHIRMVKAAIQATFPNIKGPVNVSHDLLNGLANAALPSGIIMLYSGTTAPLGWALCDGGQYPKADGTGNVTTPDLRDRVAVGASPTHPLGSTFGQAAKTVTSEAGGGHTPTGSTGSGGAHSHSFTATGTTGLGGEGSPATIDRSLSGNSVNVPFATAHTHSVSIGGTTSQAPDHSHTLSLDPVQAHAHQVSVDVTQPSIALNYIMKL